MTKTTHTIQSKILFSVALIIIVILLLKLHNYTDNKIHQTLKKASISTGFERNAKDEIHKTYGLKLSDIDDSNIIKKGSRTGEFCLHIDSTTVYQNIASITRPKPDQYYSINIHYKSTDKILLIAQGGDSFYMKSRIYSQDKDGWVNIQTNFYIPPNFNEKSINVYLWNINSQNCYVDDFSLYSSPGKDFPEYDTISALRIFINQEPLYKLQEYRKKAHEAGMIGTESKQFVKALVHANGRMMDADIRFKGDWLDHLDGEKWSFRIRLTEDSWNGLREFSIQSPETRNFLSEWLLHKIAKDEGLLTTRYGFIPVYINGESRGIYAYEEHFEKQIIESNQHKEGPILKYDETYNWSNLKNKINSSQTFETSEINAFNINKIISTQLSLSQFKYAQNLLYNYKWMKTPASEIFDADRTAKLYALLSASDAFHATRWHNKRFYYNPIISRLEPIVFDGYNSVGNFDIGTPIWAMLDTTKMNNIENAHDYYLLKDSSFRVSYIKYLKKFSKDSYFKDEIKKYKDEINYYESIIREEFPFYHYDPSINFRGASHVRNNLDTFIASFQNENIIMKYQKLNENYPGHRAPISEKIPASQFLHAYKTNDSIVTLEILFPENITITGFSTKMGKKISTSKDIYNSTSLPYYWAKTELPDSKYTELYFQKYGVFKEFSLDILPHPEPETLNPRSDLCNNDSVINKFKKNGKYVIPKGIYHFDEFVIVPANSQLTIQAGAKIHFSNGAGLLSFSTVNLSGTSSEPIFITGDDSISGSFSVLQANDRSIINHSIFTNQNCLSYKSWTLTGSVCFYESDVNISNCEFSLNHSEDILNIIRSDFNVKDSKFSDTFSDAFDSDFCTGELTNGTFINTGNDAIDFSGSKINISNCKMTNIGDKAISGGEHSNLIVNNCTIKNSVTGIASKDLSELNCYNTNITNVDYGVILMEKKLEFGPGKLYMTDCKISNAKSISIVEMGSIFSLNGKLIEGNKKNLKAIFY